MLGDPVELSRQGIEVWQEIPDREGYQASNLGRIRSLDRETAYYRAGKLVVARRKGRVLKPVAHKAGGSHFNVSLASYAPELVHHLIMRAFIGPRPEGLETRHLDDVGSNNALYNLCYGTKSENQLDCVRNGGRAHRIGSNAGNVKLTEADVIQIKASLMAYNRGMDAVLASQFGVSRDTIQSIKSGRNWSHLNVDQKVAA